MAENNNEDSWETVDPTQSSVNKKFCRKSSRITLYSDGTFSVALNYCHRWDCDYCAEAKRQQITASIVRKFPDWHWVPRLIKDPNTEL